MKKIRLFLAVGLLAASSVAALASARINIDMVQVGDTDNNPDDTGYGRVDYIYYIGTYEVTNSQYTTFLNETAADEDPYGLYNSLMGSTDHGGIEQSVTTNGGFSYSVKSGFENKPVNFVSFWDAARFTNWLTSGNTEEGVYMLTAEGIGKNTIERDEGWWANGGVAIASENEWYKAAYYDGYNDVYNDYPTQRNSISQADANYYDYGNNVGIKTVTDVGDYEHAGSHYGTFDQGGNVWEWHDTNRLPGESLRRCAQGDAGQARQSARGAVLYRAGEDGGRGAAGLAGGHLAA